MKKFPFFSSLVPSIITNNSREGNIYLIRNTILQSSSTFKYSGWNKFNFLGSVDKKDNHYYCIFCLSILKNEKNEILVYLDSGEHLTFFELLSRIKNKKYAFAFLFLYVDESISELIREQITESHIENVYAVICKLDNKKFLFALSCELVNWWKLASSKVVKVTFEHLVNCVTALVNSYQNIAQNSFDFIIYQTRIKAAEAWHGGDIYALDVDIDKIKTNAREEQLADTIKRISDCANYPRDEHLPKEDRLVSSQALFWLSENCDIIDIDDWMADTRLYADISHATFNYKTHNLPLERKDYSVEFVRSFLNDFITIPKGEYNFGSDRLDIESEPPANTYKRIIDEFRILKYPATYEMWKAIIDINNLQSSQIPITNVNFFDVCRFVEILNKIIQIHWPIEFFNCRVNLPTEYQWEAAARGFANNNFPWGNDFDIAKCNVEMTLQHPSVISLYSPQGDSSFGCQDMSGNVREWTRSYGGTRGVDWQLHSDEHFFMENNIIPSSRLIIKGGSYSYSRDCVQTWVRNTQIASRKDSQTGFRLVIEKKS